MTEEVNTQTVVETQTTPSVPAGQTTQEAPTLTAHQQFLEMLPEDLRGEAAFVDFKGENLQEVLGKLCKSYINTKKLVGADKNAILKIPSTEEDKDGWGAVYSKLGRPDDVKGYEFDKYKDIVGVDEKQLEEIAQIAHENGVSKKAFQGIVEKYFEQAGAMTSKSQEEVEKTVQKYTEDLKSEWGQAYEAKTNKVLSTLKEKADPEFLKLAGDYPFIFDHPAVMKTIDNLLAMSKEDEGIKSGGSSGSAPMTPNEAKVALAAFEGDENKMKILLTPGHPQREVLQQERSRLFKYAFGG